MSITQLKTLLLSAKHQVNSLLSLNRSKQIKYEEKQYFDLLNFLSIWNVAAKEGSMLMNLLDDVPSNDALLQQLQKLELTQVEQQFDAVFAHQYKKQFRKKKPKVIAIIDLHEQETYSKHKRTHHYIRGGKHKNGTNFFFKFATIQILAKNKLLTMKVRFFKRGDKLQDIVQDLVLHVMKYVKKIEVLLLDRGFRNVDMINDLQFLNIPLLMPSVKDNKVKQAFAQLTKNKSSVRFSLKNAKGEYADVTLLMIRLSNGKEIGFYTTLPFTWFRRAKYFLTLYAKRWNIETSYRVIQDFLPKTTSISGVIRYFFFCYATAMHNLWLAINQMANKIGHITVNMVKFMLTYYWITTHLNPAW